MRRRHGIALAGALGIGIAAWALPAPGQHAGHGSAPAAPGKPPVRISEEALHAGGGVPPGWRFTVPPGDPAAGRKVFVQFKCYTCHAVAGEQFPLEPGQPVTAGPELTGMGSHHPAEYFAESILNPSAVVIDKRGYAGGDGRSIMPPTPEMTLGQWVDVVAYVKNLTASGGHHDHGAPLVRTVGPYEVRLAFAPKPAAARGHQHHDHQHHQHAPSAGLPAGPGTLAATVTAQGQPVPYLTVTARIEGPKGTARSVTLAPTLGEAGLHYAARTTLPDGVRRIAVSLSPAALAVGAGGPREVLRPYTVAFEWK